MKTPDGKTEECAVVTDHEEQEWNMGITYLSFMCKVNIAMLKCMILW